MITPTEHDKAEWSRLAKYCYANGRNDLGHRFSMAATLRVRESCNVQWYYDLQSIYRGWLCFNELPAKVAV